MKKVNEDQSEGAVKESIRNKKNLKKKQKSFYMYNSKSLSAHLIFLIRLKTSTAKVFQMNITEASFLLSSLSSPMTQKKNTSEQNNASTKLTPKTTTSEVLSFLSSFFLWSLFASILTLFLPHPTLTPQIPSSSSSLSTFTRNSAAVSVTNGSTSTIHSWFM